MLQYSKFVNTKAYDKANPKNTSPYPIFKKSTANTSRLRRMEVVAETEQQQQGQSAMRETMPIQYEAIQYETIQYATPDAPEPSAEPAPAAAVEPELKHFIHPSVNLEEMQKKEELSMQEEDWLSFFMGKSKESPWTEDPTKQEEPLAVSTFNTEYGHSAVQAEEHAPIVPPARHDEGPSIPSFQDFIKTHEEEAQAPSEISWAEAAMEAARQIEELRACEEREAAEAALKASLDAIMDGTAEPLPAPPLPAPAISRPAPEETLAPALDAVLAPVAAPVAVAMPLIDPARPSGNAETLNEIFDEMIKDDKIFKREYKI